MVWVCSVLSWSESVVFSHGRFMCAFRRVPYPVNWQELATLTSPNIPSSGERSRANDDFYWTVTHTVHTSKWFVSYLLNEKGGVFVFAGSGKIRPTSLWTQMTHWSSTPPCRMTMSQCRSTWDSLKGNSKNWWDQNTPTPSDAQSITFEEMSFNSNETKLNQFKCTAIQCVHSLYLSCVALCPVEHQLSKVQLLAWEGKEGAGEPAARGLRDGGRHRVLKESMKRNEQTTRNKPLKPPATPTGHNTMSVCIDSSTHSIIA